MNDNIYLELTAVEQERLVGVLDMHIARIAEQLVCDRIAARELRGALQFWLGVSLRLQEAPRMPPVR